MDIFGELMRAPLRAAAAAAARELGVFAALPFPAGGIAQRLRVRPRRLAALLRVLVADGVVEERDGMLRAGSVPPSTGEGWDGIGEAIRADRALANDGVSGAAGETLRRFHDHLSSAGKAAAQEVAQRIGSKGPLLDLGGGAGAYSRAFLDAHPGERAVIVDRPAVLDLARRAAPAAEHVALDLLGAEPWPSAARVSLLANVLHLYGREDAARLVARAARAVVRGGIVAVKDFDASSPAGILFSLNMAIFTEQGEVHEEAMLRSFLEEAGLQDVAVERLRCAPESLLVLGRTP